MHFTQRMSVVILCGLLLVGGVASADLVSYWSMDEGGGATAYDSANSNDGTLVGATWTAAGKFGSAVAFDGSTQFVDCGNDASLAVASGQDFTYSMWFNDAAAGGWAWLLDQNGRGADSLVYTTQGSATGSDQIRFSMQTWFNDVAHGVTVVQPNVWNHVVLTRTGDTVTSYLNGVKEASTTGGAATSAIGVGSDNLYIGKVAGGPYMNGAIDDVAIWHNATSARRVAAMAGLGEFANVPQVAPEVDAVVAMTTAGQSVVAGSEAWTYTSVFPAANTGVPLKEGLHYTGTDAKQYIILEDQGGVNGLRGVTNAANANLVSHWTLDDGAGQTVTDSAIGGNNGWLGASSSPDVSDPAWAAGRIGGATSFAGNTTNPDEWVTVPSDPSLAVAQGQDFTYSLWFKGPGVGSWRWLLNQGDAYNDGLFITAQGNAIRVSMGNWFSNTINTSGGVLDDDTWYHLALTRDGGDTVTAYLDGVPFATGTSDVAIGIGRGLSIGKGPGTYDGFNGLIDDVGVWHEALDAERLAAIAGLGEFAALDLASPQIDDVLGLFAPGQHATAGIHEWYYTELFATPLGGGSLGAGMHYTGADGGRYIILSGNAQDGFVGVTTIPEPATLTLVGLGLAALIRRRRVA